MGEGPKGLKGKEILYKHQDEAEAEHWDISTWFQCGREAPRRSKTRARITDRAKGSLGGSGVGFLF